ncbi:hypothetical protein [Mesorhizobium sp. M1396]|uniref:hypothetical protein n=1 Tax=Mesorhizobium sp. M1396 TaxID=2957095 RepID=UPI00333BDD9B
MEPGTAPDPFPLAQRIGIGDLTATVRRRVDEDFVSISIPPYNFPHSIIDHSKVKRGQEIELTGVATRIDDQHRQGAAGREIPGSDT